MNYARIPDELKELPQWVVADEEKRPYNPNGCAPASVTDPNTWGTFKQAYNVNAPHIGFVFTANDPYAFIDLDDPEKMRKKGGDEAVEKARALNSSIYNAFGTYAELSQSGFGVHLLCRGHVAEGRKRDTVELYTSQRYAIMTGEILRDAPITDQQPLIDSLWGEMSKGNAQISGEYEDRLSPFTDAALIDTAIAAKNGDKFSSLCRGEWQSVYPSQSEADYALLSMLCFYSPNNEQIKRVFRLTSLGTRAKAQHNDTYLNRCLKRIRSKEPPPVDVSKLILPAPKTIEIVTTKQTPFTFPPGCVGAIAEYILGQAIRPVPEIALAGAIAFAAGIMGRAFNVSGSGLNHYIAVVALTGTGKEAAADGINKLIHAIRPHIPTVDQFFGPGVFASGQAIVRTLDKRPGFLAVLGEFGHTLSTWSDPRESSAVRRIKQVLLDSFSKSGKNGVLYPTAYSDSEKDTKLIVSPSISILGEATPESFFDGLSIEQVSEGLIPRFSVIEYRGERPDRNPMRRLEVSETLLAHLVYMARSAGYMAQNNTWCDVVISDEAKAPFDVFDIEADKRIRGSNEASRQLWNRAHLKALKLAALLAAADYADRPVISLAQAEWAIAFVQREIDNVISRFSRQEYGQGEIRHEAHIRDLISNYAQVNAETRRVTYKVPALLVDKEFIPFCYLRRRLKQLSAFANDRRGSIVAIRLALQDLIEAGVLQLIPPIQATQEFNTNSPVYTYGPSW